MCYFRLELKRAKCNFWRSVPTSLVSMVITNNFRVNGKI